MQQASFVAITVSGPEKFDSEHQDVLYSKCVQAERVDRVVLLLMYCETIIGFSY